MDKVYFGVSLIIIGVIIMFMKHVDATLIGFGIGILISEYFKSKSE